MASSESGAALARRLEMTVWRAVIAAQALGVIIIIIAGALSLRAFQSVGVPRSALPITLGFGLPYFGFAALMGRHHTRRVFRSAERWLTAERTPTGRERQLLLEQPWRQARWAAVYWLGEAAFVIVVLARELAAPLVIRAEVSLVAGCATAAAAAYLLVERVLRPAYARALHVVGEDSFTARGLGVVPRLLLVWVATSALPLGALAFMPVGLDHALQADIWTLAVPAAIGAIITGAIVTLLTARSIDDPLRQIQHGLRQVREGDLNVQLEIDDATGVGLVQAGFNQMVTALRERERLHELLDRHLGTEVAEHALGTDGALGGELVDISALFVDIVGSTGLARRQSPAELVENLNAFFAVIIAAVSAEGGWVNKFEGDAALCVFGAPLPQDDHAGRALRAARAVRCGLIELRVGYPDIDAGIGVSSGTAVAGNVGSAQRYEYTVIGDAVNEAARLSEEAKSLPDRVLASGQALAAADSEEAMCWSSAGRRELRGRDDVTHVFVPLTYARNPA